MGLVLGSVRLCRIPAFIRFISTISPTPITGEDDAAAFVRSWCGISSRGELRKNDEARKRWFDLIKIFNDSIRAGR